MKLLIVGSRGITEFDLTNYVPDGVELIISGGAQGIDTLAEQYADKKRIDKLIMRPKYNIYGKGAPLKRNEQMVDMADYVLVIWDGKSKGSEYTAKYAKKQNKTVKVVLV
jgi:predicted Rossmann fold nucleotide-binding protein DprA/Smf involved in DNA uptake